MQASLILSLGSLALFMASASGVFAHGYNYVHLQTTNSLGTAVSVYLTGRDYTGTIQQFSGSAVSCAGGGTADDAFLDCDGGCGSHSDLAIGNAYSIVAFTSAGSYAFPDASATPSSVSESIAGGSPGPNYNVSVVIGPGQLYTNTGCITLVNTTSQMQAYQFVASGNNGSVSNYSGDSSNITVNGVPSIPYNGQQWVAVYPGETVTVCGSVVKNTPEAFTFCAIPTTAAPCYLTIDQPRLVNMCNDGTPAVATGTGGSVGCGSMSQVTTAPSPSSGPSSLPGGSLSNFTGTAGIDWQSNSPGLALNDTVEEAAASEHRDLMLIYQGAVNDTYSLLGAISNLHVMVTNLGGGSNVIGSITNFPTNYPDAAAISNGSLATALSLSNSIVANNASAFSVNSNFGYTGGMAAATAISNLGSAFAAGAPTVSSNGAGWSVSIGNTLGGVPLSLPIALGTLSSTDLSLLALCRACVGWVIILILFRTVFEDTQKRISELMATEQVHGSSQAVLGTNASLVSGGVYAAVIIGFVVVAPAIAASFLSGYLTSLVSGASSFSSLTSNPAFAIVTAIIPMDVILASAFSYFAYRFVLAWPATVLAQSVIKWLIVSVVFLFCAHQPCAAMEVVNTTGSLALYGVSWDSSGNLAIGYDINQSAANYGVGGTDMTFIAWFFTSSTVDGSSGVTLQSGGMYGIYVNLVPGQSFHCDGFCEVGYTAPQLVDNYLNDYKVMWVVRPSDGLTETVAVSSYAPTTLFFFGFVCACPFALLWLVVRYTKKGLFVSTGYMPD